MGIAQLARLVKGGFPPAKKKPGTSRPDEQADEGGDAESDAPPDADRDQSDGGGDVGDEGQEPDDTDTDGDGEPDDVDADDDSDGVPDTMEEGDPAADGDVQGGAAQGEGDAAQGAGLPNDIPSLLTQIIETERNYYASVGHAGDNHFSAKRALDLHHRAVRALVRLMQKQGGAPGVSADLENEDGAEGEEDALEGQQEGAVPPGEADNDNAQPEVGTDDADTDGEQDDGEQDDAQGAQASGDDKAPPFPPKKKKPPFGKSMARHWETAYRRYGAKHGLLQLVGLAPELRKSTWDFRDSDTMAAVPEQYLMAYLVAFIESAYQECCRGEGDPKKAAPAVMLKLVSLMPRADNLRRAAVKYKITEAAIATILRSRGIIPTELRAPSLVGDAQGLDVMGASGLAAETLQRSTRVDWMQPTPITRDPRGSSTTLHLADRQQFVRLADDRGQPRIAPPRVDFSERDSIVKANVSAACPIHSLSDMRKTDMLTHSFAKCSCPR